MAKNPNKYRFDLYVEKSNAMTTINWCKQHSISVNSFFNHLLVTFLLNRDKYTFTFATDNNNQQISSKNVDDDITDDDLDCFPEILKRIADGDDF